MVVKDGVDYDSLDGEPAKPHFPDCGTGYRRQCASGSVKPSVHALIRISEPDLWKRKM